MSANTNFVTVDLEVDFHNIDETGYVWARIGDASDPSIIRPGVIVVVADDDDLAMGRVVDLFDVDDRTFVHVDVLPGTVDAYFDAVARHTASV